MGRGEYDKLRAGETIRNVTDWQRAGMRTTARGVCFFLDDEPKEERIHYVSGACRMGMYDYYVVFEASVLLSFRRSVGIYRDPGPGPYDDVVVIDGIAFGRKCVTELSLDEYDDRRLPVVEAYAVERDIDAGDWAFRRVR